MALYDVIGLNYAALRRPDARIASAIHAALGDAASVVNVGAGAGSYEPTDRMVLAVEPSEVMIRQRPADAAPCLQGWAETLSLGTDSVDVALGILTFHHWTDQVRGLAEMARVVKPGGRIVTVNHFAVEGGLRGAFEKWLAKFGKRLGWHPDFRLERLMGRSDLRLIERRTMAPGIYTLLVFERL